ncbi:MAG: large conductance mechanosensitive channel protein MscL [Deltaproteobacteria bacterium]|nr:large conductance mechanosensitive channel protein MscL [Deltaproteobacteria bacterium]
MFKEFREFAIKGNVVDMAVGIMIGAAFSTMVKSLVDDVIMPPIGLLTGGLDFSSRFIVLREGTSAAPYASLDAAQEAGAVVLRWGQFLNTAVSLVLVAMVLFFLVRWINRLRRPETEPAPTTRACPFCRSHIDEEASRCPQCTSEVEPEKAAAKS